MEMMLRASRHLVVVGVLGCLVMFAMLTIYAAVAVGSVLVKVMGSGFALSEIAVVTVYAFKILDLFLLATILYIVALGLGALFLETHGSLPSWLKVRDLQDLKAVLSQSVVLVILVAFLGDVLEWERGSDILFVGAGIALVIAAAALMLRYGHPPDSRA